MLKRFFTAFVFVVSTMVLSASGTSGYTFLEIPVSAYQSAQGGCHVASESDGVNAVFVNPSLLRDSTNGFLSMSYSSYLSEVNLGSIAYGYSYGKHHFALGARLLDYGTFDGYDEYGRSTGSFSAKDLAFSIGYARELFPYMSVGLSLKPIFSDYESYHSFALAVDVGTWLHLDEYHFSTGLVFSNIGRQLVSYTSYRESLPFNATITFSKGFSHAPFRLNISYHHLTDWDLNYRDDVRRATLSGYETGTEYSSGEKFFRHIIIGGDFLPLNGRFRLSASYNRRRADELELEESKSWAGFSFGAGLVLKKFNAAFSMSQYQTGVWQYQFTVGLHVVSLLKK